MSEYMLDQLPQEATLQSDESISRLTHQGNKLAPLYLEGLKTRGVVIVDRQKQQVSEKTSGPGESGRQRLRLPGGVAKILAASGRKTLS